MLSGELGQDLAVKFDLFVFERFDKAAVFDTQVGQRGVDAVDPEGSEVAFAHAAVAVRVGQRFNQCFAGALDIAVAQTAEALGRCQDLLVFTADYFSSFDSSHDLIIICPSFGVYAGYPRKQRR